MSVRIKDHEKLHKLMYDAHCKLTAGATLLHDVAGALYQNSRYEADLKEIAPLLEAVEKARKLADEAWLAASKARVALIQKTGCNNSCHEKSE